MTCVFRLLAAGALTFVSTLALAQSAPLLQLAGAFQEKLSQPTPGLRAAPDARDSLRTLVGLHLGEGQGAFQVDQVGVLLERRTHASDFCVRMASEDSRYVATNVYGKTLRPAAEPFVETHSKYAAQLADLYDAEGVVIRILAGSKCGEKDGFKLVPAIPPGPPKGRDRLRAFLNVALGADVWLMSGGKAVAEAACRPARGNIVMYNFICDLGLERLGSARPDAIKIRTLERGAPVDATLPLLWYED